MPFQCNQQSHPRSLETSDDHLELVAEVNLRISLYPRSDAVDTRVVLSQLSHSPSPDAARLGLCEDAYVDGVAAVFTGRCLSAVSALIYFRKKRKRVGMKIEIQYNQT